MIQAEETKWHEMLVFNPETMELEIIREEPGNRIIILVQSEIGQIIASSDKPLAETIFQIIIDTWKKINTPKTFEVKIRGILAKLEIFLKESLEENKQKKPFDSRKISVQLSSIQKLNLFKQIEILETRSTGGTGARMKNALLAYGCKYLWQLALIDLKELKKMRNFGQGSILYLDQTLGQELGENYQALFSELKDIIWAIIERSSDSVPEINNLPECKYILSKVKPEIYPKLEDYYAFAWKRSSILFRNYFSSATFKAEKTSLEEARKVLELKTTDYLQTKIMEIL